jgi:hypothetical protein
MARTKQSPKKKPGQKTAARKARGLATDLPVFVERACEFSDDPKCLDNAVWVVRALKQELIGGAGTVGNLWQELTDQINALCRKKEGRRRIEGDWLLLFVGYVMSKEPEMMEFWKNECHDIFWVEAGFDISEKPSQGTLWNRFTEMEKPEIVAAISEAADALIQNAMRHDEEIGQVVHIDATGFESRAIPHHACEDPETCAYAHGPKTVEAAATSTIKKARWKEVHEAPTIGLRHPDAAPVVEVRPKAKRGTFKKFVTINGHRCGLHDKDAGVRAYTNPDGSNKEFWVGGYDIVAVDAKYGGKLQGVIAPADRQECNLYFPLMRRLERTIKKWPDAVTSDRGQSLNKIFRFNTRRGIASVFPFRRQTDALTREDMRYEEIDEHGVVRCPYCGSECEQLRFELRRSGQTVDPTFHVRCKLGLTDECKKVQIVHPDDLPNGYRLLIPLSRLTERYHALKSMHRNAEHTFRHQRQRYRTEGNDETGKLKRFGTDVHVLRCEVARMVEWFRLSVRFGWLGSERRIKHVNEIIRRGHRKLASVRSSRARRGLALPYGVQAHRLGFAPTPDVPPPRPPKT